MAEKMQVARLRDKYENEIAPKWSQEFGVPILAVPRLEKVTLNMGLGNIASQSKVMESAFEGLSLISGQKPVWTKAKKSVASYRLRAGVPIGLKVTLRRQRMYEFIDRLVTIAMPRIRDFRGLPPRSFDGNGNFAMGIKEYHVFPEIDYDKIEKILGLDVVICTTAQEDKKAREFLSRMGFPFQRR